MSVLCDRPTDRSAPAALTLRISAAGRTPTRVVVASELLLGRDVDGEGRLEHPGVSRQHARISRDAVGRFVLDDIGSTNGTFLNGSLVCERLSLAVGDTIRLGAAEKIYVEADSQAGVDLASAPPAGDVELAPAPPAADVELAPASPAPGLAPRSDQGTLLYADRVLQLRRAAVTVGRAADNTICIASERVSLHHARFELADDGYAVTDLDTRDGTYLNGERLRAQRRLLASGDRVTIAGQPIRFLAGQATILRASPQQSATGTQNISLEGDQLTIGRDSANDLVLEAPKVSRFHAEVHPPRYWLRSGTVVGSLPPRTGPVGKVVALIPVHDEVTTIARTVGAIVGQTRPPDDVYVLVDNVADRDLGNAIAARIESFGVRVTQNVSNDHRKAGNLNIALSKILPNLEDADIVMGFDADSMPDSRFIENAVAWIERGYGSIGATFHGRPGGGVLGTLQRAEFARFAQHQHRRTNADVLSGTGWGARVYVMRAVAATRKDGYVYNVRSLVEDYELTLALKRKRIPITAPGDCRVLTDVMETARDWVSQRLRWQHGTIEELRNCGWAHESRDMIVRQTVMYLGVIALPLAAIYLTWSFLLYGWQGINPLNAKLYMACIIVIVLEQAWQARKAGFWPVVCALLIIPELLYSIARQFVYVRALWRALRRKKSQWGAGTRI